LLFGVTQKVTHKGDPTLLWVTLPMPKAQSRSREETKEPIPYSSTNSPNADVTGAGTVSAWPTIHPEPRNVERQIQTTIPRPCGVYLY